MFLKIPLMTHKVVGLATEKHPPYNGFTKTLAIPFCLATFSLFSQYPTLVFSSSHSMNQSTFRCFSHGIHDY